MYLLDLTVADCGGVGILKIIKFVWELLDLVFIIVPVGLIVMISVDFAKNVLANKVDDMHKNLMIAIKRVIFCVVIFLVPIIVDAAINLLGELKVEYAECITIATTEDLSNYEEEDTSDETTDSGNKDSTNSDYNDNNN